MRIIRHPKRGKLHRPVVALGTFDGVHVGHKKVITGATKYAKKLKTHSAVITFDPHPQEIIAPTRGLKLLTTLKEREELFCGLDADSVVVVKFSNHLKKLSCQQFVGRYLIGKLGVRAVFVGYDYAFGHGRSAGVGKLKKLGEKHGFAVKVIPPITVAGQIAKSGRIREFISQGEFGKAVKMLGHAYRVTGKVVRGRGRGAELGFPTANLRVDDRKLIPAQGVYVGFVNKKKCVVNIGSRPTFGAGELLVEVHILGFTGSLRGKTIKVDLFARLRDEQQFTDTGDLIRQIKKDIARARRM
ncbi:MAG: bifunctional riboflavin kinase/FAD synthetase [Candidatus Margulisbacteria bacterium]|nr:bifunctional riboflavin kinase/FAD synthetase [Candidatus Margulisiibacteriota bacterium]